MALSARAGGSGHSPAARRSRLRNSITVQPAILACDIQADIEEAFKRNAVIDSDHVEVDVQGPQVTLRGEVRSWAERDQAYKTAASAPGIINVVDELTIRTRTREPGASDMRRDSDIKRDVDNELKWNPEIDSADMFTNVTGGAVTLSGFARTLHERHQAELSVKRVAGAGAVANGLAIRPNAAERVSDPQIARAALQALKRELPATWEQVRLMVRDGRVVLEGLVN